MEMQTEQNEAPLVYILLLNWKGWVDTIECLESIFRNEYPNYRVIICDNDSQDGSIEYIKAWADGRLNLLVNSANSLRQLSFPPISKPIPYVEYDRATAEKGGYHTDKKTRLILIQNQSNLGFAGGNNVGLRYALARGDLRYVWLLNNDTVIKPDTLFLMVRRIQKKPNAGICGSTLLYYHKPDRVQMLGGGKYNRWLGFPSPIEANQFDKKNIDVQQIETLMDYVSGASMLVSRSFLQTIGLMSEDYFLYFEELDWATRARGLYTLAYEPKSIVYHKEGASIGSSRKRKEKSLTANYYSLKNRRVFTRKFYSKALPTVYMGLFITMANRIFHRQWDRVLIIIKIILGK